MVLARSSARRRAALAAFLLGAVVFPGASRVVAAPTAAPAVTRVDVVTPAWVPVDSGASTGVRVRLARDVPRLNVRMRLYDDSGTLLWQDTLSRRSLEPGAYVLPFASAAAELALEPGVYDVRAEVSTDGGASATEATGTLLVADPKGPRLPVSVIVRIAGAPQRDPAGVFVADPLVDGARSEAESLAHLALLRPEYSLSAAVPPILLDEWGDAANGYDAVVFQTTTTVSADGTGAVACRGTLDVLGRASGSGLSVLGGMYAEPDPEGLALSASAESEVADQIALGSLVASDTLRGEVQTRSVEPTGLAVPGGILSPETAMSIALTGVRFVVVDPSTLSLGGTGTVPPGIYTVRTAAATRTTSLAALALDSVTARLMLEPGGGPEARSRLLRRSLATSGRAPVALEFTVGAGATVAALQPALQMLAGLPWVRLVDAPTAAGMRGTAAAVLPGARALPAAPEGYWDTVARADTRARALASATGPGTDDARACLRAAWTAGSRCWAGADGSWSLADRGLAYARSAEAIASRTLDAVRVEIPAVTLSGTAGKVPVSIRNGSDKTLHVVVTARSPQRRVTKARVEALLLPGENILSVPVDLGQSLSAPLTVAVSAGGTTIVEATSTVRGSYLDRIVVLVGVVLVLLALLLYVRAKARPALARRRERADDSDREAAETPERHIR